MRTRTALLVAGLLAALPAPATAATLDVTPGHSIQAAVDRAHKGDTVKVHPGSYTEKGRKCPAEPSETCAVVVKKDGIKLVGVPTTGHPVVLLNPGKQKDGIAVARTGDAKCLTAKAGRIQGSLVAGFTVKGFAGDGVFLFCVDAWRVTKVRAVADNVYGIFPSHSGKGRVDHSFASGANDTGIYIGQSHDVRIDHSTARANVSGFEIENSKRVRADHNTATGNTAGMLSFDEPGLDTKINAYNVIERNVVHDNNRKNTCLEPGDVVCNLPPGAGVVLVAADINLVRNNDVRGNGTGGIAVVNWCIIAGGGPCKTDTDPNPDYNEIRSNVVKGNGKHPDPSYKSIAADLIWDGTGQGNCWAGNVFTTAFPSRGFLTPC